MSFGQTGERSKSLPKPQNQTETFLHAPNPSRNLASFLCINMANGLMLRGYQVTRADTGTVLKEKLSSVLLYVGKCGSCAVSLFPHRAQ